MSKRITISNLKTLLASIKEFIDNKKADWFENDPQASGYILNRPFYEEADGTVHTLDGKFIPEEFKAGRSVTGKEFVVNGETITASPNAEIFGDYETNIAVGQWSVAEGSNTIAKGRVTHAEGAYTQALQDGCHTEGYQTIATGYWSHAEGEMTRVTSYASHAEGSYTKMPDGSTRYGTASGYASHIEGGGCYAEGSCSHAEGLATTAKGNYSHAEGRYTIAGSNNQHVEGVANIEDTASQYIHIAGNGTFDARKNAYTLDWNGNGWFSGDVYVGSTSGTNKDEGSKKLATEEYVNIRVPAWTEEDEGKVLKIINGIPTWGAMTISFSIDEENYEALPGMTWKEWCESSYNTGYWTVDEYAEVVAEADNYITLEDVYVKPSDFIKPNINYDILYDSTH